MLAEVKASAAETGGRSTLVEITAPAGSEAPLHVHYADDEGFYVLEGSVTILVGDERVELDGRPARLRPARRPAPVRRRPRGAKMLWVLVPGGFEDFIEDVSVPAGRPTVPPGTSLPPENAAEIVLRHGMELLPE